MENLIVRNYLKVSKEEVGLVDNQIKVFINNFIDTSIYRLIEFSPSSIYLSRHGETSIEHFTLFGLTPKNSREMVIYITALNYGEFTKKIYKGDN